MQLGKQEIVKQLKESRQVLERVLFYLTAERPFTYSTLYSITQHPQKPPKLQAFLQQSSQFSPQLDQSLLLKDISSIHNQPNFDFIQTQSKLHCVSPPVKNHQNLKIFKKGDPQRELIEFVQNAKVPKPKQSFFKLFDTDKKMYQKYKNDKFIFRNFQKLMLDAPRLKQFLKKSFFMNAIRRQSQKHKCADRWHSIQNQDVIKIYDKCGWDLQSYYGNATDRIQMFFLDYIVKVRNLKLFDLFKEVLARVYKAEYN